MRYAVDTETGDIVAVKKITTYGIEDISDLHKIGKMEEAAFNRIGDGFRLASLLGVAHVILHSENHDEKIETCLFLSLANKGDGEDAAQSLSELRRSDPQVAERKLRYYAKEYAGAVAELHARGECHRDIKLENFLYKQVASSGSQDDPQQDETIKLTDFGFATNQIKACGPGTKGLLPPEYRTKAYDGRAHDVFSLALTLLHLKKGVSHNKGQDLHLTIKGVDHAIQVNDHGNAKGINGVADLPLDCFDHILARMLDVNPETRLTSQEAFDAFETLHTSLSLS